MLHSERTTPNEIMKGYSWIYLAFLWYYYFIVDTTDKTIAYVIAAGRFTTRNKILTKLLLVLLIVLVLALMLEIPNTNTVALKILLASLI